MPGIRQTEVRGGEAVSANLRLNSYERPNMKSHGFEDGHATCPASRGFDEAIPRIS